ncbi:fumarylacetoacetate hydrolase family protein [Celerinatantimonas yamalensis]|uniref:Fumarylacetoacetate hydrolase family protein n=1 Tax=Celerinatantimonas yamalensis TaxID=559956 RepID=A0ABW9G455_9GAMM
MSYQHINIEGHPIPYSLGKIVCVGQNYADHIQEMNSQTSSQAVFFIKPRTAACRLSDDIVLPSNQGSCHHEIELALLIGQPLHRATIQSAQESIVGYTLAIDLTLRDLQAQLKAQGHPWEKAKGFDGAAPLGPWLPYQGENLQDMILELRKNGQIVQHSSTELMLRDCITLLSEASQYFSFEPGDVLLTGTPSGVGPLVHGDHLQLQLSDKLSIQTKVRTHA